VIVRARLQSLLFCSLAFFGTAYASQQEELENLRKRIVAMQHEMDKTSESKSEAADSLRESERAISNSNRKLAQLASQQYAADIKLGNLQAQQQRLSTNMAANKFCLAIFCTSNTSAASRNISNCY
jgi:septal ring factor EnvC (AmiA/AmiB activator)